MYYRNRTLSPGESCFSTIKEYSFCVHPPNQPSAILSRLYYMKNSFSLSRSQLWDWSQTLCVSPLNLRLWPLSTEQKLRLLLPMSARVGFIAVSGPLFGLAEACPHTWAQYAWGSRTWSRPSIRLSSFAKLQGTTHYGVILLIGPLSSPPHSCRVPPHSVRMEYACKPPPWNCYTRALPLSPMWKLRLGNIMLSS